MVGPVIPLLEYLTLLSLVSYLIARYELIIWDD
jgi:hypothetical protein